MVEQENGLNAERKERPQAMWGSLIAVAVAITICGMALATYADRGSTVNTEAQLLADDISSAINAAAIGADNQIIEFTLPRMIGGENYSLAIQDSSVVISVHAKQLARALLTTNVYVAEQVVPGRVLEIQNAGNSVLVIGRDSDEEIDRGWAWADITIARDGTTEISSAIVTKTGALDNVSWTAEGDYSIILRSSENVMLREKRFEVSFLPPITDGTTTITQIATTITAILPWNSAVKRLEVSRANQTIATRDLATTTISALSLTELSSTPINENSVQVYGRLKRITIVGEDDPHLWPDPPRVWTGALEALDGSTQIKVVGENEHNWDDIHQYVGRMVVVDGTLEWDGAEPLLNAHELAPCF